MNKLPSSRTLLSIAVVILFIIFLIALLFITNLSFSVWEQLQAKPVWVQWSYALVLLLIALLVGVIIWRLLMPKKKRQYNDQKTTQTVKSIDEVAKRLESLQNNQQNTQQNAQKNKQQNKQHKNGDKSVAYHKQPSIALQGNKDKRSNHLDLEPDQVLWQQQVESSPELTALKQELAEFTQRKEQPSIYIALFGDISSGKSSLIQTLIQSSDKDGVIETSVLGGTTRSIKHYYWPLVIDGTEQEVVLTDMPGLNEQFAELDVLATEEAVRAHLVIYLCDGDLTASQFKEVSRLLELGKPCIIAINKSDQYSKDEITLIEQNIRQQFTEFDNQPAVVNISAGGEREFIRLLPDGREERVRRPVQSDIQALKEQIVLVLQKFTKEQLEGLREQAVASMLNERLDELDARFKYSQSRRLVNNYTKKAVVAALATISPGTDLLVQGYLGIQMIKDLCKIYGVSATDIDANKLLELIQSRMDKTLPLLLAIAGNGLKAFPGVGTVSGGLMHAVAYGMIFDTLGKSVARTLEVTGELSAQLISDVYKEQLSENIESRTKDFIKLVLRLRKED